MRIDNFFAELKRRNVYKVAVAYAIVGWLLVQIATQVFPFLEIPTWVVRLVIVLVAAGFPIALVIAWAFELTPEGIKRTEDVGLPAGNVAKNRTWIYVAVVGAALSVGLFFIGRYTAGNTATPRPGSQQLRRGDQSEAATVAISQKSIAVLPFASLSEDKSNAYFAEGIQDEILARLSKIADLKVISRTSTLQYQSKPGNLSEIGKQLGVGHVLEGSVQKVGDQVRVSVQLINAQNESITLYFDEDTHLPVKKSFEWRDPVDRQKNLEEEIYENYRSVSGIMAPFNVTRYFNGDMASQRFFNSVTINQGLDAAMFDPNSGYNPNKPGKAKK